MRFVTVRSACLAAALLPAAWAAHPLETDDADTLGAQKFELEATLDRSRDRAVGVTDTGTALGVHLGYGLSDALDVFIEVPYLRLRSEAAGAETRNAGVGDVSLGLKYRIAEYGGLRLGFTGSVSLGNADELKGLGPGKPGASMAGIVSGELAAHWQWHGNVGLNWSRYALDGDRETLRTTQPFASLAVGYELGEAGLLVAEFGTQRSPDRAEGRWESVAAVGGIWHASPSIDLSAAYRHGVTDNAADHVLTAGITAHF